MKIDSSSQPIRNYPSVAVRPSAQTSSASPASASGAVEATTDSSGDITKIHAAVKKLMAESAVRPEALAGRSPSDPVKAFDENALRQFVSALQGEESE